MRRQAKRGNVKVLSERAKATIRARYIPGGDANGGNGPFIARVYGISETRVRRIARAHGVRWVSRIGVCHDVDS
jgi:hypothetical protein